MWLNISFAVSKDWWFSSHWSSGADDFGWLPVSPQSSSLSLSPFANTTSVIIHRLFPAGCQCNEKKHPLSGVLFLKMSPTDCKKKASEKGWYGLTPWFRPPAERCELLDVCGHLNVVRVCSRDVGVFFSTVGIPRVIYMQNFCCFFWAPTNQARPEIIRIETLIVHMWRKPWPFLVWEGLITVHSSFDIDDKLARVGFLGCDVKFTSMTGDIKLW